ncbi:MAG TPA: hypothetical protein VKA15_12855 [Isosphaeraceae bacterium]|nr:hypothetical protein [Isosphaeraceae bacterium]
MNRRAEGIARPLILMVGIVVSAACSAFAQEQEPAVISAIQYLRTSYKNQPTGESAMTALALLKAEVPANDPDLLACVARIHACLTTSTYEPVQKGGHDIYEAGVCAMVLANQYAESNRPWIKLIADYLLQKQKANGSWDYVYRTNGDASISQYAILGLWESENAGVDIPPSTWDRAATWYMSVQSGAGSWCYHRDEGSPETLSMTAAGVGSLLICQRQLDRYRGNRRGTSNLMKSLVADAGFGDYHPTTTNAQIDAAVRRGLGWISANFNPASLPAVGQTPYYMLYGIERIGALADRDKIGRVDWYERGRAYITST